MKENAILFSEKKKKYSLFLFSIHYVLSVVLHIKQTSPCPLGGICLYSERRQTRKEDE